MDGRALTLVALAAVLPRVAFFAALSGRLPEPSWDQEIYLRLAGSLMEGDGLSFSRETAILKHAVRGGDALSSAWADRPDIVFGIADAGEPTAAVEPGYPLVLAGSMSILGAVTSAVILPNLAAQVAGALACALLAARLGGRRSGLAAGLGFALYPYLVYFTSTAMTEAIHSAAIPCILLATVNSAGSRRSAFAAGALTGLAFLVRSTVLFLLPLELWYAWRRAGPGRMLPILAGAALCIAPWVVRNAAVMGAPVLLPTKGSLNLWMRSNPEVLAEEGIFIPADMPVREAHLLEYPSPDSFPDEVSRSAELGRRALGFIAANPRLTAWLAWQRLLSLLSPVPASGATPATIPGIVAYTAILLLGGFALARGMGRPETALLAAVFILYLALHTMGHGGVRYRVPVDPVLIVAAATLAGRPPR